LGSNRSRRSKSSNRLREKSRAREGLLGFSCWSEKIIHRGGAQYAEEKVFGLEILGFREPCDSVLISLVAFYGLPRWITVVIVIAAVKRERSGI
jgi:hypothetical protein